MCTCLHTHEYTVLKINKNLYFKILETKLSIDSLKPSVLDRSILYLLAYMLKLYLVKKKITAREEE